MDGNDVSMDRLGYEILSNARNELFAAMPYMDLPLAALRFQAGQTDSLAVNGETLFYKGNYLANRYLRSPNWPDRAYLHVILHCMLRHLSKKQDKDDDDWDLACDIAVESILDQLDYKYLAVTRAILMRQTYYGRLLQNMKVLTAEGIYLQLQQGEFNETELAMLRREFRVDDHRLWKPQTDQQEQNQRQDKKWQNLAEKTQSGLSRSDSSSMQGGEAIYQQLRVQSRAGTDFRKFLQRFAAPREVMAVDGDAFDYIYYTYGLSLYGNMPLIELPETKEAKRIDDFVIAIDTSMSTSGQLVREFLSVTYSILQSTQTFTHRMNIHIIQCDDQVRSDVTIRSMDQLQKYMDHFELIGESATDFRPVFEHVDELLKANAFTRLRGLIYFTDGMGIFPKKRPPYETAFIMMEDPGRMVRVPAWAIRVDLTEDELVLAKQGISIER